MNDSDQMDRAMRRILAEVGDAAGVPPRLEELAMHRPTVVRSQGRSLVGLVAGTTVAAGIIGVIVLRPGSEGTTPTPTTAGAVAPHATPIAPGVTAPAVPPGSPLPTLTAPAPAPGSSQPTPPADSAAVWFLPSTLPAGYELTDISARTDPAVSGSGQQTWVKRGADGRTIVSWATGQSIPADDEDADRPSATVHGQPATLTLFSDDQESWTVAWSEAGARHSIQVSGVDTATAVALAESTTVTDGVLDLSTAAPALGYEVIPQTASTAAASDTVFLVALPTTGTGAIWADITSPGRSLDEVSLDEDERRLVDGTEFSLTTRADDTNGPYSSVRFTRDGWLYTVTGRAAIDTVLTFATGLQPVSAAEAESAHAALAERTMQLPAKASGSFGDGTTVSVRAPEGVNGAIALCIEAPVANCRRPGTETTLTGVGETSMYELFHLPDGRRVLVGWQPADWTATADNSTPIETINASSGSFILVDVGDVDQIPAVNLTGPGAPTAVYVTPNRRP